LPGAISNQYRLSLIHPPLIVGPANLRFSTFTSSDSSQQKIQD